MATLSRNFTVLPEPTFLTPQNPGKILKLSISRTHSFEPRCEIKIHGTRIRAVKREESTVLDERDKELETKLNGSVNGNGKYSYSNGSAGSYANGSTKVESGNGSLVKYVNGNRNGNGSVAAKTRVEVVKVDEVISEKKKKKTVEEIGQEDAWFKRKGKDRVEVHSDFCDIRGYNCMLFVHICTNLGDFGFILV